MLVHGISTGGSIAQQFAIDHSPELFRQTAERIPNGRLRLYPDKGHAGVLTHKPAIREIVAFLPADDQPRT